MDIRAACRIISIATGTPAVIPWAARLRKAGMLPPSKEELGDEEIICLLLAVAASPCPDDAPDVIERIENLHFGPPTPPWRPPAVKSETGNTLLDLAVNTPPCLTNKMTLELMIRRWGGRPAPAFTVDIMQGGEAARTMTESIFQPG